MGNTLFEFGDHELRIVGGDYGQIHLEGATEEARRAINQIVEATRRRSDGFVCNLCVEFDDVAPTLVETRHAGLEGTPEGGVSFVGGDAAEPESSGAEAVAETRDREGQSVGA